MSALALLALLIVHDEHSIGNVFARTARPVLQEVWLA